MRIHRLELDAWGPFLREVVVDFDALAAEVSTSAHGATGAGQDLAARRRPSRCTPPCPGPLHLLLQGFRKK